MSEAKKALLVLQHSERIKSELIIAFKLFEDLNSLKNDERKGAEKLLLSFLNTLKEEINVAQNVSHIKDFEEVRLRVEEAALHLKAHEFSEALRRISEAVSLTTTSGQKAVEILKRMGLPI